MSILIGIFAAWAVAWGVVGFFAPSLWIVAALGFAQNLAFTFVSRGRNSGSLLYHMVASVFSNGIWLGMFVVGVKIAAEAPTFPVAFAVVYVLSTMSGSVFAHYLARKVERGAARNVQEDRVEALEHRIRRGELTLDNHTEANISDIERLIDRVTNLENEKRILTRRVGEVAKGYTEAIGAVHDRLTSDRDLDKLEALRKRTEATEVNVRNLKEAVTSDLTTLNDSVNGLREATEKDVKALAVAGTKLAEGVEALIGEVARIDAKKKGIVSMDDPDVGAK